MPTLSGSSPMIFLIFCSRRSSRYRNRLPSHLRSSSISRHVSIRTVVVFPAPLGPRNPKTSPSLTSRVSPSTAAVSPNFLVRFSVVIKAHYPSTHPKSRTKIVAATSSCQSTAVVGRLMNLTGPQRERSSTITPAGSASLILPRSQTSRFEIAQA